MIPVLAEHEFIHTIHRGVGTEGRRLGGSCESWVRLGPILPLSHGAPGRRRSMRF